VGIRKLLKNIRITGVAGVDHPAHLTPGWAVMKSADRDSVNDAVNEVVHPVLDQLAKQRRRVEEVRQILDENDRALRELEAELKHPISKSAATLRSNVEDLADKLDALRSWLGPDVAASLKKAETLTADDASRIFWGLD